MVVCLCNNTSEVDIKNAVDGGCKSFDEILKLCKLKFQCRICEEAVRSFSSNYLKRVRNNEPC